MEIWKSIKGYEELYEISSYGRVRNFITKKVRNLFLRNGYLNAILSKKAYIIIIMFIE